MLVSIDETGSLLGVSRTTVYKLINQKTIEAVHVCRRRLVIITSVNEYIASQNVRFTE